MRTLEGACDTSRIPGGTKTANDWGECQGCRGGSLPDFISSMWKCVVDVVDADAWGGMWCFESSAEDSTDVSAEDSADGPAVWEARLRHASALDP